MVVNVGTFIEKKIIQVEFIKKYILCLLGIAYIQMIYSQSLDVDTMKIDIFNGVSTQTDRNLPSVCGVTFGEDYSCVEKSLQKRYGEKSINSNRNEIIYYDFPMGNNNFNSVKFCFQYDKNGKSFFYGARFSLRFDLDNKSGAVLAREYISKTLSKKYGEKASTIGDDGIEYYFYGEHPFEDIFLISLYVIKGKSNGGELFYYLTMEYGPVNFINTDEDF